MKIIAFSRNGKMAKIGEDSENSKWYFFTEKVANFITKMKVGDSVKIKSSEQEGKEIITFVENLGGSNTFSTAEPSDTEATQESPKSTFVPYQGKTYGKSPDEQNSIKRQAIGHMTSRTLIGLQGMIDLNNVTSVMETIYKKYVELVG